MSLSRALVIAACGVGLAFGAQAADHNAFTVTRQDGNGKPLVFQSTAALKKGDVIRVNAFNAQPVLILQMAMCDGDCTHPRLVQSLPLVAYYAGQSSTSRQFVVPEDGRVYFWVQWLSDIPSVPVNAPNGTWNVQFVDPFLRFATPHQPPYESAQPMPANALTLDADSLRARFLHRTFVTVTLADANP